MKALLTSGGISNPSIEAEMWRLLGSRRKGIKLKERLASSQTQQKGLMTTITYQLRDRSGSISWAAAEEFEELREKEFSLGKMEATQIDQIEGMSSVAKLLLSAVAGALIQHLIDEGASPQEIFASGTFKVQ